MPNERLFLQIDKYLYKLGLNPTQATILAQIMEFNRNTGDCFMSDKKFAETYNISESTVSREIQKLAQMGLIIKETKSVKGGGRERHLYFNSHGFSEALYKKLQGNDETSN